MNNNEYFELKYLEEIYELFNKYKEINNRYNTNIIKNNSDPYDFYLFLQDNLHIEEPYIDNNDNNDDNNENY
jgi:hypothetical protein